MKRETTQMDPWGNPRRRDDTSLAARFMQELLDLSEDASPGSLGAVVIFMPPIDEPDPDHRAANMRMAAEFVAEERTVVLWTVGKEPPYTTMPELAPLSTGARS